MNSRERNNFIQAVWNFYTKHKRDALPWRKTKNPYNIAVSEIMLQQTQVSRVIKKYKEFIKLFPTVGALAAADLALVLRVWSGLGYNRRAKYLHQMSKVVQDIHKGKFPKSIGELIALPGIGPYTAGAILSFAYNKPAVLIETNIRTIYIHHFFPNQKKVSDKQLAPVIEETIDQKNPREWYWALMDYGSFLKASGSTVHRTSAVYVKQSTFKGSRRQLRGAILRLLMEKPHTLKKIRVFLGKERYEIEAVVGDLVQEGMIRKEKSKYKL